MEPLSEALLTRRQPDPSGEIHLLPTSTVHPPPSLSHGDEPSVPGPRRRLASLDVFRGLTVALMILVDDAGGAFPAINHAPWTGVTIADFVVPFFLFGVGVSAALVFKKAWNKAGATRKVVVRTTKLFLLGVLLQGGYFHGRGQLTYGVDLDHIRLLGILQRIAIGYFFAAISEVWLVKSMPADSAVAFTKKFCIQWMVAAILALIYMGLIYGLYVPDWTFESSNSFTSLVTAYVAENKTVHCDVRGSLSPSCNAAGLIDRVIVGSNHLYQRPVYRRTKECSIYSPDSGPPPPNAPAWCFAPFDPEGILSSLMAAVTCFIGLHFGHLMVYGKSHMKIVIFWAVTSIVLIIFGYITKIIGMPFCKPLYTLSYMFLTSGASGLLLTVLYFIVDIKQFRKPTILFQWMGMNALIVYALAASELFPAVIQGFYWKDPSNNLVALTEKILQTAFHSKRWGTMAFVLLEIVFWCLVAGFLHKKGIYIKL